MTEPLLPVFQQTLQKTNDWLREVAVALGTEDRNRTYQALRATLHAPRDRIGLNEAAQLGARLPLLLRGTYYEGWHPAGKPLKERDREQFLDHVRADISDAEAEDVVRAVLQVMAHFVSEGEVDDIVSMLREGVRDLWPQAVTAR